MSVPLSVSKVRRALYAAAGADADGDGLPSTRLLGQWFHDGIRQLVGDGSRTSPLARLDELDADLELWKQTLVEEAYLRLVGPRLTSEQAALHDAARQVLAFWRAMRAACDWLAELSWNVRMKNPSRRATVGRTLAEWFSTEEALTCILQEPGWSDSVQLDGVADAIMRLPETGRWCVIEFKLGQTSPTVDLGQACLYHLMLSATEPYADSETDALALISFRPERHERVFTAAELASARERLIDLIGKLAGVDQVQSVTPPKPSQPIDDTPPHPKTSDKLRDVLCPTEEHYELGRGLVKTWAEYGVNVSLDQPVIAGPTFVRFPITLGRGTKVRDVHAYAAELQVRLQLKAEPFISRDDGQLVIDVQRPDRQTVWFDDVQTELPPPDARLGGSQLPVGVNLFRQLVCADLAKPEHAHFLVAGTTGSGKSEWLRMAVAGLITTNTPDTLRLVVIDPKRNAFHALRASPYLWQPLVFPDEQPAAEVLVALVDEMERRYRLFDGADSFAQLVARSDEPLPRIVCVCDEYRDLISRNRGERRAIEEQICRLGAKARAAGIHLILATQEPSRDTIKGPLDSNIPARVGLKMSKPVESRMLLNHAGAEKLLGHGDLLFKSIGDPRRLQAPLLSEANRKAIFEQATEGAGH